MIKKTHPELFQESKKLVDRLWSGKLSCSEASAARERLKAVQAQIAASPASAAQ